MRNIRVAAVQFEHADGNKEANLRKVEHFVSTAAEQQVEIIAFPECCLTGYWFLRKLSLEQLTSLAELIPQGPSTARLLELAKHNCMTIGAGLIERDADGRLYNSYVVAMPDGRWAC